MGRREEKTRWQPVPVTSDNCFLVAGFWVDGHVWFGVGTSGIARGRFLCGFKIVRFRITYATWSDYRYTATGAAHIDDGEIVFSDGVMTLARSPDHTSWKLTATFPGENGPGTVVTLLRNQIWPDQPADIFEMAGDTHEPIRMEADDLTEEVFLGAWRSEEASGFSQMSFQEVPSLDSVSVRIYDFGRLRQPGETIPEFRGREIFPKSRGQEIWITPDTSFEAWRLASGGIALVETLEAKAAGMERVYVSDLHSGSEDKASQAASSQ